MIEATKDYKSVVDQWQTAKHNFELATNDLRDATSPNWKQHIQNQAEQIVEEYRRKVWNMNLRDALKNIDKYLYLGISRADVACLVASWDLSPTDLEQANNYIHDFDTANLHSKLIIKGGIPL